MWEQGAEGEGPLRRYDGPSLLVTMCASKCPIANPSAYLEEIVTPSGSSKLSSGLTASPAPAMGRRFPVPSQVVPTYQELVLASRYVVRQEERAWVAKTRRRLPSCRSFSRQ